MNPTAPGVELFETAHVIVPESDALGIEMLYTLGLRPCEMAALQARDVDRERRQITIALTVTTIDGSVFVEDRTKTRKTRVIPVPEGMSQGPAARVAPFAPKFRRLARIHHP